MHEVAGVGPIADLIEERGAICAAERFVVGVVGAPGAGKTTLAQLLHVELGSRGHPAAILPMDGFHLPQATLRELGRRDRMGAADTFDAEGYARALAEVRANAGDVRVPGFDRTVEESVPDALLVPTTARVVITEGNWLLLPDDGWSPVAALLDLKLFLALDDDVRVPRLIARHIEFGKSPDAAREWVLRSDEANARRVMATAGSADVVVRV